MSRVIAYSGNIVLHLVSYVGELSLLLVETFRYGLTPPLKWRRIFIQSLRVGPGSFFISCLVAFFIGVIMSLQMANQMTRFSAEIYIPSIVALSLTRELSPVLTALIVAGRFGAGITAEIGSMKVTEQIDALKAFAVNPVKYLVVPRFLAMVIMLPLLTVFADLIGIFGGYVICVNKLNVSSPMFVTMVVQALSANDIITGLVKTICFGALIALVGCHQGLNVKGGAESVGKATTRSVVISFILIILSDCLFTTFFHFIMDL